MAKLMITLSLQTLLQVLTLVILLCCQIHITYSKMNQTSRGLELKLIHIDSPDSPMYQPELTPLERIKRLVDISESRMRYLDTNITRKRVSSYGEQDMMPDIRKQGDIFPVYFVEFGLGEFDGGRYHSVYLVFDTGSNIMWTQCENCRQCFYQTSPYFPKSSSRTYIPYPCNQCPGGGQCYQDHCHRSFSYGDGTTVEGIWAKEKLTFTSPYYVGESFNGFTFLCGIGITNFVSGNHRNNMITGMLGIGKGDLSLISQLGDRGGHTFSYCLQRHHIPVSNPSIVRFGDSIIRLPGMSDTPFFTTPNTAYYYLSLTGISVNGDLLSIPQRLFAFKSDGSRGTIIDTGAVVSFLVPSAYKVLLKKISTHMQNYNSALGRYANSIRDTGFHACWEPAYEMNVQSPSLTFHFQNDADLYVYPSEVIIPYPVPGVAYPGFIYCLTVNPSPANQPGVNLIGTYPQVNQLMIYDLEYSTLSFIENDCSVAT